MSADTVCRLLPSPFTPPSARVLRLGYVPLTDCAPLVVAAGLGLFQLHGVAIELTPLPAWSPLRDRVAFGVLDGAQMLSPMPLAAALGLGGVQRDMAVVATLGMNGNTVVFGNALMREIAEADPARAGCLPVLPSSFAAALAARAKLGRPVPILAVVFALSSHNYLLRYWLRSGGIDPDRDVRLVVVPPADVPDQLADGTIEGFCAGEPWGSRAVDLRVGQIALSSADIWQNHPEKVLAFSADTLAADRPRVVATVAAIIEATRWLAEPENADEATHLLRAAGLADVPESVVALGLRRQIVMAPDEAVSPVPPMFRGDAATFPFVSHGRWWLGQMAAWQHVAGDVDPALPARIWQPAVWREAAALVGEPAPLADSKTEGGHAAPWLLPAQPAPVTMPADLFIGSAVFPSAFAEDPTP